MKEIKELVGLREIADRANTSGPTVANYIEAGEITPDFVLRRPNGAAAAWLFTQASADKAVARLNKVIKIRWVQRDTTDAA